MGLFDRISRVVRANLNDLVSKAEDPEKVLEQSLIDMQEDLVKLRQAVAQAIATQKRTEQQYNQNLSEGNKWQQRAQLALTKGDENLAREALVRKKSYSDSATALKTSLDQQVAQIDTLKKSLIALESKISEAKTKKDMLKARISAAKAQEQLQSTISGLNTGSAMSAFERMEDKVLQVEARAQAAYELGGTGIDQQFAALEAGSDVDDELAMLKAQMSGGTLPSSSVAGSLPSTGSTTSAPPTSTPNTVVDGTIVDAELEELRRQLNKQ